MQTKISYEAVDVNNKTISRTINYVNPEASAAEMKAFVQQCLELTTNVYSKSDRVDETNLDTAVDKPTATIGLATSSVTVTELKAQFAQGGNKNYTFTYNGDGTVYCYLKNQAANNALSAKIYATNNVLSLQSKSTTFDGENADIPAQEIILFAAETANYKATQTIFTVTD